MTAITTSSTNNNNEEPTTSTKSFTTRVCIKNIPNRLCESSMELRRHFNQNFTKNNKKNGNIITELKILKTKSGKPRNTAFVGFQTKEIAKEFLEYFDKTFIGTSKLHVEYAYSNSNNNNRQENKKRKVNFNYDVNAEKKQKLINKERNENDLDLKEFHHVSSNKVNPVWKDDDGMLDNNEKDEVEISRQSNNSALKFLQSKISNKEKLDGEDEEINADEDENTDETRLFLRNLSYQTTEDDLKDLFSSYSIKECHIPIDESKHSKGIAFVTFPSRYETQLAKEALHETDFQGRIIQILPCKKQAEKVERSEKEGTSYKLRNEKKRKKNALTTTTGQNSTFVHSNTVMSSTSQKYNVKKSELFNDQAAAVRMAIAETQIHAENQEFFKEHGVITDASSSTNSKKSDTTLLIKNLPPKTTREDLLKLFRNSKELHLAPSKTIAIVVFDYSVDAKKAFRQLAYKKFWNVPLYLEWASIDPDFKKFNKEEELLTNPVEKEEEEEEIVEDGVPQTLFIKNLNFSTTEEDIKEHFTKTPIRHIKIQTKTTVHNQQLSLGYGFLEFSTAAQAKEAVKLYNKTLLHNYNIELQPSQKKLSNLPAKSSKQTKIIVKNVPFQCSKSELHSLFGTYGQVKKIRLPNQFGKKVHRGFGFVEFVTTKEANDAMQSLSNTHLYGRHLVLEWALQDDATQGV